MDEIGRRTGQAGKPMEALGKRLGALGQDMQHESKVPRAG